MSEQDDEVGDAAGGVRHGRTSVLARYGISLLVLGTAFLFRLALSDALVTRVPYVLFYPAIFFAGWFGGLGPGVLVTAVAAIAAIYALPPPGLLVSDPADRISVGVFVATGVFITWLIHRLHEARLAQQATALMAVARAERLDAILNLTADGVLVLDETGRIEAFNRGAQSLFGYAEADVLGHHLAVLMPPRDDRHEPGLQEYLDDEAADATGAGRQLSCRRRDGTLFPVHLSVREMRIAGERKFTGILRDLTSRVRLEGALGASEARWRAIVDSAVDGIVMIDARGRVEAFNQAAERLFGYTAGEVLGRNVSLLMPSPDREQHDGYLARYTATGEARVIGIGREVQGRRKDGSLFPLHLSVGEARVAGQRKFTGILHDLSGRVRIEQQLREQDALARLGEMAAVIAHEIKNPLAGIRGAMQVFGERMVRGGTDTRIIDEIVTRIDSLDRMMKDLLLFARPPKPKRSPTDLVPLVQTTARLLRDDPAMSEVQIEIEGQAPPVPIDPDMIRVVFHNLLVNGAHAMEGRGRIRVAIRPVETGCQVSIADGGPGIPPDIRDRIFTPFFTTKARGSGLGLPTVKRLVEAHQGQVLVECPATGGTTVVVRLPIA
jgi:two-component system sensor kinase FixL